MQYFQEIAFYFISFDLLEVLAMTTAQIIRTAAEFIAVILVIWGVLNKGKLIDFEDQIISKVKSFLKSDKKN